MFKIISTALFFLAFAMGGNAQSIELLKENYLAKASEILEKENYDRLDTYLDENLKRSPQEDSLIAEIYHYLGLVFHDASYFDISDKLGNKALQIKKSLFPPIHKDIGRSLALVAANYYQTARITEAEVVLEETKVIWENLLDVSSTVEDQEYFQFKMAVYYEEKSKLAYLKGEYLLALDFTEKSKSLMQKIGNEEGVNDNVERKGLILSQQGMFKEAIQLQKKALEYYLNKGEGVPPKLYNNLSYTFIQNKDYDNAILNGRIVKDLLEEDLKNNPDNKETVQYLYEVYSNLGLAYGLVDQKSESDQYFQKAFETGESFWKKTAHHQLAENYRFAAEVALHYKNNNEALELINKALACFETEDGNDDTIFKNEIKGEQQELLKCIALQASILAAVGRFDKALQSFQKLDSLVSQIRQHFQSESARYGVFTKLQPIYEEAILTCIKLFEQTKDKKYQELAYFFSSKNKALLLLDDLYESKAKHFAGIQDSLVNKEKQLQIKEQELSLRFKYLLETEQHEEERIQIQKKLIQVRGEREILINFFEESYPQYFDLKYGIRKPNSLAVIQDQIPVNSMLLEYFVGEDFLFVFAITKDQLHHYKFDLAADFRQNCLEFRKLSSSLDNYNEEKFEELGYRLFQLLLERPLKDKKDGINRLIIIPNEELLYISFDNLLTAPNSDAFLIRDYAISYAYSNQLLNRAKEQKNRQKPLEKFIGFGIEYDSLTINSVFRQQSDLTRSLSKLEYAVEEVQAIASILGGQTLINQFATKEAFFEYAPNTSILHLAMHGIIDEQVLNEASLVFTKSPESEEHLLRSSDLYAMELNNNLAVLSACNTANGSIQRGEGIRSLARAFSYAGCSSLVASLWLAPDRSSKDILVQFYENLEDGMPKDVALQKAKLSYLDSGQPNIYKAPIFWSHLMVFGDTNPIKRSSNWMYWIIGIATILFIFYFIRKK